MIHSGTHTSKPRAPRRAAGSAARFEGSAQRRGPPSEALAGSCIVEEIVDGLQHNEFEPYFQPKVDIRTFEVVGTEALARWHHPQFGTVRPHVFVGLLERAGKSGLLARCMLAKAARFGRTLAKAGRNDTVAVNVSLLSLSDRRFADDVIATLESENFDPRRIVLDVVCGADGADPDSALENLARLHGHGFALSIDPFGDIHALMQRLAVIPFSELKIDPFFVTHAAHHRPAREMLASTIGMARRLGIRSVVEGVETRASWSLLTELGCDCAQGHYFAEPMAGRYYAEWLRLWPGVHVPAV